MNVLVRMALIPALLSVQPLKADAQDPKTPAEESWEVSPELIREEKMEDSNFYRYKDNYILTGNPNTKVQLSLKLRPILGENFYFGYTQQMFWKLSNKSKPFQDISFNPEIFYEWVKLHKNLRSVSFGIEHKSNGKDGLESRSLDRFFVESGVEFGWMGNQFRWDTRGFWIYDIDWQTNNEIKQYTGFWYTRFAVDGLLDQLIPTKAELYVQFNPGGESGTKISYGSLESGLKIRARLFGSLPYLMLQYYHGYMESLLDYNKPAHSYRVGFLL
ncbi:MAG TPA: phospholipase A [Oligoflexus sp.]|uniref:phospholipase A n=1 Tax=Oligoflexus sp. TaxID=1971216 RepID=UPI002D673338|nr:phospholipase A [Oligoflexus sp.]HYX38404.1 phospholipase A [Oligoflexus sp.]